MAEAGLLSAMPSLGMVVTLIAWGYVADRIGERTVLATGSALTAVSAFAAASVSSLVVMGALLFLGEMAAASCNPACGRLVAGCFRRISGGWPWESARLRNRWESPWAPW